MIRLYKIAVAVLCAIGPYSYAQGVRVDNRVTTVQGNVPFGSSAPLLATPQSIVTICSAADCPSTVSIYADEAMTTLAPNPMKTDTQGRFGFWVPAGTYFYQVKNPFGTVIGSYPFTAGGSGSGGGFTLTTTGTTGPATFSSGVLNIPQYSGGSVSSVGLNAPGTIFSISGSPVTGSGTLSFTLQSQAVNSFFAGPSTGSPGAPSFRLITAADLPLATTSLFGAVKCDGSTISCSGGVISAVGGGGGISPTPVATQTIAQPAGTSFDPNIYNHTYDASQFSGANIGAKVNAAIAAVQTAYGGGIVEMPAGTYNFSTKIKVPQRVTLRGHGNSTQLNWTGGANSGCAIVGSDVAAPNEYVNGVIEKFTLNGTNAVGTYGICQGGDSSNVWSPSTDVGYNYIVRDVTIYYFDTGIIWGNNTLNIEWNNVNSSSNNKYGWYYPATSIGGGQNNHFYHTHLQGNLLGGFVVDQPAAVTYSMIGSDIQYNGNIAAPTVFQAQIGGTFNCFDCHIESNFGPFFQIAGNENSASFFGGSFIITNPTGTDPALVHLVGGRGSVTMDGTFIYVTHDVTELVTKDSLVDNRMTISVKNLQLADPSFFLKAITTSTGQGVEWCTPWNNQTGTGPGTCYNGNIANASITLAKLQNATANSKLLGSGAAGSGSPYAELNLGTNLSMSGTTLNATGGGGTPGGSSGQMQYNNSGSFGGDSGTITDGAGHLTFVSGTGSNTAVNGTIVLKRAVSGNVLPGTPPTNSAGLTVSGGKVLVQYDDGSSSFIPNNSQWDCQPGLGDGLNAIPAGTYLQSTCQNSTTKTVALSSISCIADAGSSTVNVTNSAGTALLTGAITCGTTYTSGTQSGTVTLSNADYLKFTIVGDGTAKQISIHIVGARPW